MIEISSSNFSLFVDEILTLHQFCTAGRKIYRYLTKSRHQFRVENRSIYQAFSVMQFLRRFLIKILSGNSSIPIDEIRRRHELEKNLYLNSTRIQR